MRAPRRRQPRGRVGEWHDARLLDTVINDAANHDDRVYARAGDRVPRACRGHVASSTRTLRYSG